MPPTLRPRATSTARRQTTVWVLGAVLLTLAACGAPTAPNGAPTDVSVTIDPPDATMVVDEQRAFTATVTGSSDTAVTWTASAGTVTGSGATIIYRAPDTPGTVTLRATSVADGERSASAVITVEADDPPQTVVVTLAPTTASLAQGQSQAFTATVTGSADTGVTWSSSCGSVTGSGTTITYTAPDTTTTCTLTATSSADPTKTATATINVTGVSVSIDPAASEAFVNQSRTFTAVVTGSANTGVTWALTPGCGSIEPAGNDVVYTAPATAPASACALSATSNAAPTQQASATISVYPPPDALFTIEPVDLNPPGAAALMLFGWDVVNPTTSLTLTCEIYAFGVENVVTYTIQNCTSGSQTHLYLAPGSFTTVLRVLQGATVVQTLDLSFVLP